MNNIIEWYFHFSPENYNDDIFCECLICGYPYRFGNVCESCDDELYFRIYLNIKNEEKDEAKKFGIKQYTFKCNKNINIVLKKWNKCNILNSVTKI